MVLVLAVLSVCAAAACSDGTDRDATPDATPERPGSAAPPPADPPPADPPPVSTRPRIVFLGDSLTAGYGLTPEEAYPALIEARLRDAGYDYEVINAGVSGDTSAGGRRRLDWSLRGDVDVLVIALGGNDGLRGLPPEALKENLQAMIDTARARDIDVVLAGMEAPPNFGPTYTDDFREVYRQLAEQPGITLLPFLLEGVAGDASLNQQDGIHPNAAGQRRLAEAVWTTLRPLIDQRQEGS
jgi:acyl-CoA thioesterase-1